MCLNGILGEHPENIERLFRRTYSSGFTQRPDLTVMGAFSGLEIACWDILGKDRDRPVWALLGGLMNDRIRAYSYLYPLENHDIDSFWTSADLAAESAIEFVKQGYTAVKFDPAGPYTMRGGHMPSLHDITTSVAFANPFATLWGIVLISCLEPTDNLAQRVRSASDRRLSLIVLFGLKNIPQTILMSL